MTTTTTAVTHVYITRNKTMGSARIASIAEMNQDFDLGLDLTGVPVEKIGETVEAAIFDSDDIYIHDWIEKDDECVDSETTVVPVAHTCKACGVPIVKASTYWLAIDYRGCPSDTIKHHEPAEPVDEPEAHPLDCLTEHAAKVRAHDADTGAARDLAACAIKALIRAHRTAGPEPDGDVAMETAASIRRAVRDAIAELFDDGAIADTPHADAAERAIDDYYLADALTGTMEA